MASFFDFSGVPQAAQNLAASTYALRQKSVQDKRQTEAYNALRDIYGPIAGDPRSAAVLQGMELDQQRMAIAHDDNRRAQEAAVMAQEEHAAAMDEAQREALAAQAEAAQEAFHDAALFVKTRVSAGGDPGAAFDEVAPFLPIDEEQAAQIRQTIVQNPEELDAFIEQFGGEADGEYGLNPQYGVDEQGNPVILQLNKSKPEATAVQMPEGVTLSKEAVKVDLGDRVGFLDPVTRQLLYTVPKGGTPPAGTRPVVDDEGNVAYEDVPGSEGYKEAESQAQAQSDMHDVLKLGVQDYLKLDEMGAIVNPDRSAADNIRARIAASGGGQLVGGALGTEAQSIRNRIAALRPNLISLIKQATGMGARQLDSNRELQFYLQMVSDPTVDIYANLAALQVLDDMFGTGNLLEETLPPDMLERVTEQVQVLEETVPLSMDNMTPGGEDDEDFINQGKQLFGNE